MPLTVPTPGPLPLAAPGYHSPQPCTACGAVVTIPDVMEVGGLVLCTTCGHVMLTRPGWVLADLTPAEALTVAGHPNFANIRAQQERIVGRMVG